MAEQALTVTRPPPVLGPPSPSQPSGTDPRLAQPVHFMREGSACEGPCNQSVRCLRPLGLWIHGWNRLHPQSRTGRGQPQGWGQDSGRSSLAPTSSTTTRNLLLVLSTGLTPDSHCTLEKILAGPMSTWPG